MQNHTKLRDHFVQKLAKDLATVIWLVENEVQASLATWPDHCFAFILDSSFIPLPSPITFETVCLALF